MAESVLKYKVTPDMPQEELRKICLADPSVAKYAEEALSRNLLSFPIKL